MKTTVPYVSHTNKSQVTPNYQHLVDKYWLLPQGSLLKHKVKVSPLSYYADTCLHPRGWLSTICKRSILCINCQIAHNPGFRHHLLGILSIQHPQLIVKIKQSLCATVQDLYSTYSPKNDTKSSTDMSHC